MTTNDKIEIAIINADLFLKGQLELYKIEFSETGNNDYLEVMNELNKAQLLFRHMKKTIDRLVKEKQTKKEKL